MSRTGLQVFDTTLQETNHWLKRVMEELETDDRKFAFAALRATLHALRDLIGPGNAVHLGAQLPMLLRGAYYEGWRLSETPTHERHLDGFLAHVDANLPRNAQVASGEAARAAFGVLLECLDGGEADKLMRLLPMEIRSLSTGDFDESQHQLAI
jgi:uncharacterized protein (DUF2267 family)